jgi:putative SOS response-associated peptidase YedK
MCGRYVLINGKMIFLLLGKNRVGSRKDALDDLPRYNASPMQRMPVLAQREGELVLEKMQWWLVPHWSKDGKIKATTFNAKAETLDQSKLFAPYFKSSRCLVPADAFYEWKNLNVQKEVRGKLIDVHEKQPMCIRMKDQSTFMFAGLFSVWKNAQGEEFPSFTIITTTPNMLMADIHTRMPVILKEKHFDEWLDRENKNVEELKKLLVSYPAAPMEAYPVSKYVSNSRNEGPECLKKLDSRTA